MEFYSFVVPVERVPRVFGDSRIVGGGAVSIEGSHEMAGVFFADVLDSEFVNYKGELDGTTLVFPQDGDKFALAVTVFAEEVFRGVLGPGG